jgi:hypothetical protein
VRIVTRASGWQWLTLAAALFVLNFALTFHNIWPTLWITTRHELSIEIATLLLLLALYSEIVRPPTRRLITVFTLAVMTLAIGRYAEVTAPALYGRPVNIYWDAQHLPAVGAMLAEVAAPWQLAAIALGLLALLAAVFGALRWSLARVWDSLGRDASRRAVALLSGALVVLYWQGHTSSPLRTLGWFSLPVTATYHQQALFIRDAVAEARGRGRLPPAAPLPPADLARVADTDVLVVFVESYGAAAFDREPLSQALQPGLAELAETLAATGRRAVSAFVEAPTFGGASWLAHVSFFTGQSVRDSGTYNLLLTQQRETVVHRFAVGGHRTVAVMPGLRQDWPEGAFYRFDTIYGEQALAYRGPEFGWWRVPDQYALAKLDELELHAAPRAPLFVFFPTISTHMPFRPVPPYQPDWTRLLTEQPFDEASIRERLERGPDWTDLGPAYAESLDYTLRYFSGYLRERPDYGAVWVVLGDHQPAASVSGVGTRWDVPVHVIAERGDHDEILDALVSAGFADGLTPGSHTLGPMHELTRLLMNAFSSDTAAVQALPDLSLR